MTNKFRTLLQVEGLEGRWTPAKAKPSPEPPQYNSFVEQTNQATSASGEGSRYQYGSVGAYDGSDGDVYY